MTTPYADPARNLAARLMRLAESWIEPPNRRWDRLEQMRRLVDSLQQTYAQELERREPVEPQGVGMSDKTGTALTVLVQCRNCYGFFPRGVGHTCRHAASTTDAAP